MRGYRGYGIKNEIPTGLEKLICITSYLTLGFVGFIWIIIMAISGKMPGYFVRFHIYQSIFYSILLVIFQLAMNILGFILNILLGILGFIPFIGNLVVNLINSVLFYITYVLFGYDLMGVSVAFFVFLVFLIYNCLHVFWGKYTEIPWVSDNIRRLI